MRRETTICVYAEEDHAHPLVEVPLREAMKLRRVLDVLMSLEVAVGAVVELGIGDATCVLQVLRARRSGDPVLHVRLDAGRQHPEFIPIGDFLRWCETSGWVDPQSVKCRCCQGELGLYHPVAAYHSEVSNTYVSLPMCAKCGPVVQDYLLSLGAREW